ncbi:hypothetical protein [Microbacterium pygmaeum]|uniref:Uncharacterized protein n=1 Tax=Microbacterium pygmaeum TaxID=370764 RepID=A0A1G7WVL2_9MICO|nr:hypothetical protein [Microbacterium pygmaeum]SDG75924.1 hypothetical protein SAMN04489810_1209 [Microbacterium pygmaeum]
MSSIAAGTGSGLEEGADPAADSREPAGAPTLPARRRRGIVFWIVRYLPAEIVGTAAMILAGLTVTIWTDSSALIAIAALLGETVGFYVVLAITIYAEQAPISSNWRRAAGRTFLLLVAEFGAAELLDTLLIRPAALMVGVWLLPDPLWGLLAGKVFADIIFYAIAAGAFTITAKTGLRDRRSAEEKP